MNRETLNGIDLTLDSLFNSDVDQHSMPDTKAQYERKYGTKDNLKFFKKSPYTRIQMLLFSDDFTDHVFDLKGFQSKQIDFDDEYYKVFRDITPEFYLHNYGYDGFHCDCCGNRLTVINQSGYAPTMCVACDRELSHYDRNTIDVYFRDLPYKESSSDETFLVDNVSGIG